MAGTRGMRLRTLLLLAFALLALLPLAVTVPFASRRIEDDLRPRAGRPRRRGGDPRLRRGWTACGPRWSSR